MKIDTTRRTFLGAAAGMAGLSAIGVRPASAVIEPEPWGIKLGIATYSLRMFDRAKAIEMIKKFKVQYVSIKDVHLKIDAHARARSRRARRSSTRRGAEDHERRQHRHDEGTTVEELRKQFEYAKAAGHADDGLRADAREHQERGGAGEGVQHQVSPSTITVPRTSISRRRNRCWKWCKGWIRAAACAWISATPRAPASTW